MSGVGVHRNGKRADFAPTRMTARVNGVRLTEYDAEGGLPTGAGFYLLSSDNAGVIKLGTSSGTAKEGVAGRVMIANRYWGGDMRIHELREFRYNDPNRQAGKWKGIKRPAGFAYGFEKEVKRRAAADLGWTGEFYAEPDPVRRKEMVRRVLKIIDEIEARNSDPEWRKEDYIDRAKSARLAGIQETDREIARGFRD